MSLDIYLFENASSYCEEEDEAIFTDNITHNLGKMAAEAGIYRYLWRPEEFNISYVNELIEPLKTGLEYLKLRPEYFKKFNAKNGWGTYDQFIPWLENYIDVCIAHPQATIKVSR